MVIRKTLFTAVSVLSLLLPTLSFAQGTTQQGQHLPSATSMTRAAQQDLKAVRATTLEGMTVKNQQGDTLGEVENVVLDVDNGRIAYVVLDFGGWFDFGGKYAAAPWNALAVQPGAKEIVLNVDKDKLRQAPSFERTYVPDTVERAWLVDMYKFYGIPPDSSIQVAKAEKITVAPLETVLGMDVENPQGNDLGEIEDLVFDVKDGHIAYAALAYGGWLGLGENYAAVPWQALKLNRAEREFTLNADKEKLQSAPKFTKDNWPQTLDPEWLSNVYAYYGAQPNRKTR
jgi:sporulation protein YlmC with PRC-barrel domain